MQQDPIGDGVNWYAYVDGNPVAWVDPEGYCKVSAEAYMPLAGPVGPGAGVFAGKDAGPGGYYFMGSHGGGGAGAGFDVDWGGSSPGFDPNGPNRPGFFGYGYGGSYNVSWQMGPVNIFNLSGEAGWRHGPDTGYVPRGYYKPKGASWFTIDESWEWRSLLNWKKLRKLFRPRGRVTANVRYDFFVYGRFCPF